MKKFIYYFLVITLSSCVTVSHFTQIENREDQNEVEVYCTNRPLKEYEEIEIVETISTCGVKDLAVHPYVSYKLANLIVKYRRHHGNYSSLEQLKSIPLVDEQLFRKIVFYFELD